MGSQWLQISLVWLGVGISGLLALIGLDGDARYAAFGAIAAASIAIVSIEHLISSKSKDTVRQQVYVSAGTLFLLGVYTLVSIIG